MSTKTARCPICTAPVETRYKPFCSKRCADVDLHRWLGGQYRMPTEEEPEDDVVPLPSAEDRA